MVDFINNDREPMYLLFTAITVGGWQLFLTSVSVCVVVSGFVWNLNRARRKDFEKAMEEKADIRLVESELKTHTERILNVKEKLVEHEKQNNIEFKSVKSIIEEQHATMNYVSTRVDDIYKLLTKSA